MEGRLPTSADEMLDGLVCDNVRITRLEVRAKKSQGGNARIFIRPTVANSRGHDKWVKLAFRVKNGDSEVAIAELGPISIEERNQVTRTTEVFVPTSQLKTAPMTKLEITVTGWDDPKGQVRDDAVVSVC